MDFTGDRIKMVMKKKGLSQYKLAKLTGISQGHLSDVINHKKELGLRKAKQIINFLSKTKDDDYEVDLLWLITGETVEEAYLRNRAFEYKDIKTEAGPVRETIEIQYSTEKIPQLYKKLIHLDPKYRGIVEEMIDMYLKKQERENE